MSFNWRALAFWKKQRYSAIQQALLLNSATWSSWNFTVFMNEGYRDNNTVRACITHIVLAAQECPIIVKDQNGEVVARSKLLDIINAPNPAQDWKAFLETAIVYHHGGEAPIWFNGIGPRQELMVLRPDWLELEENPATGLPNMWRYAPDSGNGLNIPAADMFNWKAFSPLNRWRGLSPLWAAGYAIDTLNEYNKSNKALLENGVTPSGVLYTDGNLEDHVFKRLQDSFDDKYVGSDKKGKPMLLEGGLKWQQLGLSPKDMDFIAGTLAKKQDICETLGVPPQILGIPGSQTFANYMEARAALYEDTVIPMLNSFLSGISRTLKDKAREPGNYLCVDVERVPALESRRAERNKVVDGLKSLKVNEKREAMGYVSDPDGDVILVNASEVPLGMAGIDNLAGTLPDANNPKAASALAYGK